MTGEILITSYAVAGTGAQRSIGADVEWTFPLSFVEVVWLVGAALGFVTAPYAANPRRS